MSASNRPRRRRLLVVGAIVGAVLLAVVLLVFEPQTLFIDTVVDDAFPGAAPTTAPEEAEAVAEPADDATAAPSEAAPSPTGEEEPAAAEPVALASGGFVSRDHTTTGTATVYELADGSRVLRFDDLMTDNGPDLKVYLSTAGPDAPAGEFDDDFVDLGVLAGNIGNQNYDLPAGVDLERYASAVIWCDRFDVVFGAAPLGAP